MFNSHHAWPATQVGSFAPSGYVQSENQSGDPQPDLIEVVGVEVGFEGQLVGKNRGIHQHQKHDLSGGCRPLHGTVLSAAERHGASCCIASARLRLVLICFSPFGSRIFDASKNIKDQETTGKNRALPDWFWNREGCPPDCDHIPPGKSSLWSQNVTHFLANVKVKQSSR